MKNQSGFGSLNTILVLATLLAVSIPARAQVSDDWCNDYSAYCAPSGAPVAQVEGRIASVATSTTSSGFQFILENQPTFHRFCDISRFLVSSDRLFDLVVDAQKEDRRIIVAYSPASGCVSGFVRVWSIVVE